jgi:hypothetical protein
MHECKTTDARWLLWESGSGLRTVIRIEERPMRRKVGRITWLLTAGRQRLQRPKGLFLGAHNTFLVFRTRRLHTTCCEVDKNWLSHGLYSAWSFSGHAVRLLQLLFAIVTSSDDSFTHHSLVGFIVAATCQFQLYHPTKYT